MGNFLVAGKGGCLWEEEERSAVGMATWPSCLHSFNSGVKCKCYSPGGACFKSLPIDIDIHVVGHCLVSVFATQTVTADRDTDIVALFAASVLCPY